jgi:hypothetical protein
LEPGSFALGKSKIADAMTTLLEKAMAEASKLPEQEQEAFAAWILAELESEKKWDELFARPSAVLERMADEAIREHEAGLTEPLDPEI